MIMKRFSVSSLYPLLGVFFAAEGGGGGGGGEAPAKTLKDQLADANLRIAELEPKSKLSDDLQTQLGEANGKVTKLEGDFKAEGEKVTKLEGDVKAAGEKITKLEGDLKASGEKVTKLEGDVKAAEAKTTKVKERAASHGIIGLENDSSKIETQGTEGAALYDEYNKLSGREKSAFFAKNEKALMAYANSADAKAQ